MQTQYFVATNATGGAKGDLTVSGNSSGTTASPANSYDYSTNYLQEGISACAGVLLLTGILLMLRRANSQRKAIQSSETTGLQARSPIPCQSCHYFNPNTFLPCAVNPSLALRKEAADCTDYCPRRADSVTRSVHS